MHDNLWYLSDLHGMKGIYINWRLLCQDRKHGQTLFTVGRDTHLVSGLETCNYCYYVIIIMQEGLKRLGVALENEEFLRALDEATLHDDSSNARTGVAH